MLDISVCEVSQYETQHSRCGAEMQVIGFITDPTVVRVQSSIQTRNGSADAPASPTPPRAKSSVARKSSPSTSVRPKCPMYA